MTLISEFTGEPPQPLPVILLIPKATFQPIRILSTWIWKPSGQLGFFWVKQGIPCTPDYAELSDDGSAGAVPPSLTPPLLQDLQELGGFQVCQGRLILCYPFESCWKTRGFQGSGLVSVRVWCFPVPPGIFVCKKQNPAFCPESISALLECVSHQCGEIY